MPSRRLLLLAAPAAVAAFALAGCSLADDGPRTTQTRHVAAFTRIDNPSSVDLRLHIGEPQRVKVRAGDKVIGDVRTEVHDGTLEVVFDHDGLLGSDVVVDASVPKLTGVDVSGSGDVDADGIDAGAFRVRSDGSADIALRGTVGRLAVDVTGSGDAEVRAARRLDVAVDGSGDVRYHGDPALTRHVDGSGELRHAG